MPTFSGTQLVYETRPLCTWILNVTSHRSPLLPVCVNTTVSKINPLALPYIRGKDLCFFYISYNWHAVTEHI
jgi:hypothetical protein